jgi:hypothetical protein
MGAARLSPQGAVDTAFGTNALQIGFSGFATSKSVGVQFDSGGRIYLGGYAANPNGAHFAVARLEPNGLVTKQVTTSFTQPWAMASEIAGHDSGTFYLAGTQAPGPLGSGHRSIALARYTPFGIDATFSGDGKATHDFRTPNANVAGLAVDGSRRPVVAGYTSP